MNKSMNNPVTPSGIEPVSVAVPQPTVPSQFFDMWKALWVTSSSSVSKCRPCSYEPAFVQSIHIILQLLVAQHKKGRRCVSALRNDITVWREAWRCLSVIHKRGLSALTVVYREMLFLSILQVLHHPLKHFPCFLMPRRGLYFRRPWHLALL